MNFIKEWFKETFCILGACIGMILCIAVIIGPLFGLAGLGDYIINNGIVESKLLVGLGFIILGSLWVTLLFKL